MKNNHIFNYSLLKVVAFVFILGSMAASCEKNEVPNPCAGAVPFKATFQILQPIGKDSLVEVDTATINSRITFKAPKGYDSYVWLVDDKPFTNFYLEKDPTQFFLTFPDPDVYSEDYFYNAKISLIAKKKPLLNCLPTDYGIDTISKNLHVKYWFKAPIFGKYFGYYGKNTKDTATVIIALNQRKNDSYIVNINKGCNVPLAAFPSFSYNENTWRIWYVDAQSTYDDRINCFSPIVKATLSANNQDLIVNFSYSPLLPKPRKRIYDTFIGKRIK